jgi:hypothetical protein
VRAPSLVCTHKAVRSDSPRDAGAGTLICERPSPQEGERIPLARERQKASGERGSVLQERVQSPSQRFDGFRESPAPSVKKPILALRQKIFRPPAPLVAVLAQGFVIFPEASDQGLHGLEFSLDSADPREKRGLRPKLGRCRCVRHDWMMAPKGYRSAKIEDLEAWPIALRWSYDPHGSRRGLHTHRRGFLVEFGDCSQLHYGSWKSPRRAFCLYARRASAI